MVNIHTNFWDILGDILRVYSGYVLIQLPCAAILAAEVAHYQGCVGVARGAMVVSSWATAWTQF